VDLLGRSAGLLRLCLLRAEVLQVKDEAWSGTLFAAFSEASRCFCDGD
jgi:hypothetical protein